MILVVNLIQPLQTILLKCCINPASWKAGKVSHLGDFCLCLLCFIHYLSGSVFEHCSNAFYSSPRDAIARNALFRQRCNNFFIDVVTTMCFKDNEPPEAEVIQELLNLLFVHRSLLTGSGEPLHPDAQSYGADSLATFSHLPNLSFSYLHRSPCYLHKISVPI